MSTNLKVWILTLVLLGSLLGSLIGSDAEAWFKGEGGAVNLPGAMAPSSHENQTEYLRNADRRYRAGYFMADISRDLTLVLPSNLQQATVFFQDSNVNVAIVQVDNMLRLSGSDLVIARDAGTVEIAMLLTNAEGCLLRVRVELTAGQETYRVYAQ